MGNPLDGKGLTTNSFSSLSLTLQPNKCKKKKMEQKEPTSKAREEWGTLSFRPIPLQWCLGFPSIRRMPTSVSTTVESSGGKVVKSTRLPPMWPGFDFQTRRHRLSLLVFFSAPRGFSPGTPVLPRVLLFYPGYSGFSPGTPVFPRVLRFSPLLINLHYINLICTRHHKLWALSFELWNLSWLNKDYCYHYYNGVSRSLSSITLPSLLARNTQNKRHIVFS